eukprot:TRINITY_DN554_c0_g1_i4.p1 TRINITY_DN554_c0_g1~~TRINITY_DN554_c0_g1_i4.p1  ORF type:complete len:155 (-),score=25.52 TRINITY_DN554_c0_g1_i4:522-986(-)
MNSMMKANPFFSGRGGVFGSEGFGDVMGQSHPGAVCSSQSFSYSSMPGKDGKQHVVQKSSAMRRAGNVQENKESHSDSHTGVERMSIQRKLGDKARKIVRGRHNFTGEEVQDDVCVNMDASRGPQFDQEWEQAANRAGLMRIRSSNSRQPSARC